MSSNLPIPDPSIRVGRAGFITESADPLSLDNVSFGAQTLPLLGQKLSWAGCPHLKHVWLSPRAISFALHGEDIVPDLGDLDDAAVYLMDRSSKMLNRLSPGDFCGFADDAHYFGQTGVVKSVRKDEVASIADLPEPPNGWRYCGAIGREADFFPAYILQGRGEIAAYSGGVVSPTIAMPRQYLDSYFIAVTTAQDGKYLCSLTNDGEVEYLKRTGSNSWEKSQVDLNMGGEPFFLAGAKNSPLCFASTTKGNRIVELNAERGETRVLPFSVHANHGYRPIMAIAAAADDSILALATGDGRILVHERESGRQLTELSLGGRHEEMVFSAPGREKASTPIYDVRHAYHMEFAPEGRSLFATTNFGELLLMRF